MRIPLTWRLPVMALAVVLAIGTGVGVMASQGGDHGGTEDAPDHAQHPPQAQDGDHGRSESAPGDNPQSDEDQPGEPSREIKGIPDESPNHQPANSDGECEKGETSVKTTPAGTRVNVPCQAADHHGVGQGQGNPHQDDESD